MLRVARLTDPSGRYYLTERAPTRWIGSGSDGLRLCGRPDPTSLGAVLSGRAPGGAQLRRAVLVSGFDLTFAPPKSVSILHALGEPDVARTVLDAHRAATDGAVRYLEVYGAGVCSTDGGARRVGPVDGVVAAAFDHVASRALDPHLHTHVVVANLGHGRDGRWRAIDGRGIYAHARAAGALYDAHLRALLHDRMGLDWRPRPNGGHELRAVDPLLAGVFSSRQAEIRAHLADRLSTAPPSGRAKTVSWAATREAKPETVVPEDLRELWRGRAAAFGFPRTFERTMRLDTGTTRGRAGSEGHAGASQLSGSVDEHRFAAALFEARHRGAARRDVVAAWAGALVEGSPTESVISCVASLAPWGDGVGVAEARNRVSAVVVPAHHLRALGPRPGRPCDLAIWQEGAAALDRYRSRWGMGGAREPLGVRGSPSELSRMGPCQLAEHLSTARAVADSRRRIGRDAWRGLAPDPPELDRGAHMAR